MYQYALQLPDDMVDGQAYQLRLKFKNVINTATTVGVIDEVDAFGTSNVLSFWVPC